MPRASDPAFRREIKYGKRVSTALLRLQKGERLHTQNTSEGVVYWLEPSGRSVGPVTGSRLIGLPNVAPDNDTLFDAISQTYRYVDPHKMRPGPDCPCQDCRDVYGKEVRHR